MLQARYEELEQLYLGHRQAVERLVREPDRFTPVTLAHFAAGQAALEAAWDDGKISTDEHVYLLQGYTAITSHSVDDYSECQAGFDVQISPPLAMTEPYSVQTYVAAAEDVRAEITARHADLVAFYDLAEWTCELLASPYRVTTMGTLLWARSRRRLGRRKAMRLDVRFQAMHILFEQHELQLPEIAGWLEQRLDRQDRDGTRPPSPQADLEDEWRDW